MPASSTMTEPPSSPGRLAWLIVALLFPVVVLNYLDRQMLATMKVSMVASIPDIANKADWASCWVRSSGCMRC